MKLTGCPLCRRLYRPSSASLRQPTAAHSCQPDRQERGSAQQDGRGTQAGVWERLRGRGKDSHKALPASVAASSGEIPLCSRLTHRRQQGQRSWAPVRDECRQYLPQPSQTAQL